MNITQLFLVPLIFCAACDTDSPITDTPVTDELECEMVEGDLDHLDYCQYPNPTYNYERYSERYSESFFPDSRRCVQTHACKNDATLRVIIRGHLCSTTPSYEHYYYGETLCSTHTIGSGVCDINDQRDSRTEKWRGPTLRCRREEVFESPGCALRGNVNTLNYHHCLEEGSPYAIVGRSSDTWQDIQANQSECFGTGSCILANGETVNLVHRQSCNGEIYSAYSEEGVLIASGREQKEDREMFQHTDEFPDYVPCDGKWKGIDLSDCKDVELTPSPACGVAEL